MSGKVLMGYQGTAMLDAGYVYAPYIPLQATITITPAQVTDTRREIRKLMKLPASIIKAAMRQAGYKYNRDFRIVILDNTPTIYVYVMSGRRFTHDGVCQVHCNKGKMNIFWTYEPTPGGKAHADVDIVLADPDSFEQVANTIIKATKACLYRPYTMLEKYNKPFNTSLYGKVTI